MSYSIKENYLSSTYGEIKISKDGIHVVTLFMRPYMFYKNKRLNFKDDRVPFFVDMHYGDKLCSADLTLDEAIYDHFFKSLKLLFAKMNVRAVLLSIKDIALYNFYLDNYEKHNVLSEDFVVVRDSESKKILRDWDMKQSTIEITDNSNYMFIFRKDSMNIYTNGTWWDKEQELI